MKQYKFGDCIPEAIKVYNRLKKQGKKPVICEGWVEVNDGIDIEPDEKFLKLFCPDDLKELKKNFYYMDYPRVIQHTWVKCDNEIIDITKSQFNQYGGILKYYQYWEYYFKGNAPIIELDAEMGTGEVGEYKNFIYYPKNKNE